MIDLRIQSISNTRPPIAPPKPKSTLPEPTAPPRSQDQSQVSGKLVVPEDFTIESTPVLRLSTKVKSQPKETLSAVPPELDRSGDLPNAEAPNGVALRKEGAALVADFARSAALLFSREEELVQLSEGNELCLKLKWLSDPQNLDKGEMRPAELLVLMKGIEELKAQKHRSRTQFKQDLPSLLSGITERLGIAFDGIAVEKPTALGKEAAGLVADFAMQCLHLFEREEELKQLVPPHNPKKSLSLKLKWLSEPKNLLNDEMTPQQLLAVLQEIGELKGEKQRSRESFKQNLAAKLSPLTEKIGISFESIPVEGPDWKSLRKEAAARIADFSQRCLSLFEREEELEQLSEGNEFCLKLKWLSDPQNLEKGELSARALLELEERIEAFEKERLTAREEFKRTMASKVQELSERLGWPFDQMAVSFPSGADLRQEAASSVASLARETLSMFSENEQLAQLANDNPLCRRLQWLAEPKNLEKGEMRPAELLDLLKTIAGLKGEKNRSRDAFKQNLEGKLGPLTERMGITFGKIDVEVPDGKAIRQEAAKAVATFSRHCLYLFEREEELEQLSEGNELYLKLKWLSEAKNLESGELEPRRLMEILILLEGFKAEKLDSRQGFKLGLASKMKQLTVRLGLDYERIPVSFPSGKALQKEAAGLVAEFARKAAVLYTREEELEQGVGKNALWLKLHWLSDAQNLEKGEKGAQEVLEILKRLERYRREAIDRDAFKGRLGGHLSELAKMLGLL